MIKSFSFRVCWIIVSFFSLPSLAVRFHAEDWGDGFRTQYPNQVKDIGKREAELLALVERVQLGASFKYLHLTDLVKRDKMPFDRYINEVVDGILSQTHHDLQVPLRRFYYYGERAEFDKVFFKQSNGYYYFRVIPQIGGQFIVTFDSEVQKVPAIFKLFKLMAVLELSQWSVAIGEKFAGDYRNQFPVVDFLNKVSSAILVQDILLKMGTKQIQSEILMAELPLQYKDLWRDDFLIQNYLQTQFRKWFLMYDGLKTDKMAEWVNKIMEIREKKSAAIKSLEILNRPLIERIRQDLVTRSAEFNTFLLAQQARQAGDNVTFRLLGQTLVAKGGPKCSIMFESNSSR